jgi:hypothetical protein
MGSFFGGKIMDVLIKVGIAVLIGVGIVYLAGIAAVLKVILTIFRGE